MSKGKLIVYSGPSGVGKGTLRETITSVPEFKLKFSVSWTTRPIREGEVDSVHYHFVTKEQFKKAIAQDKFLEWEKYADNYYGTPLAPVLEAMENGDNILLEIEVKGQKQVLTKIPDAITIFILPPHIDVLRNRLSSRNTENELTLETRINIAELEIEEAKENNRYKHFIVNVDFETAKKELRDLIESELL